MTQAIRVQISDMWSFQMGGVSFRVVMSELDGSGNPVRTVAVLEHEEGSDYFQWRFLENAQLMVLTPEEQARQVWSLPEGVGQALLEALSRHFHGSTSAIELRADLKHERSRRDLHEDRAHELAIIAAGQASSLETAVRLATRDRPRGPSLLVPDYRELVFHRGLDPCQGHMPRDYYPDRCSYNA